MRWSRHYLRPHQIALLQHCDQVLCMTETEREQLERRGVPSAKLATIGLGIDLRLSDRRGPGTRSPAT